MSEFVLTPREGKSVWLGGLGVDFKIAGEQTGGLFSIVEHPIDPGVLVPPHTHTREDEFSYVLEAAQEEDFFADLRDELEAIEKAVNALDDSFVTLVVAYADKDIIEDPAQLEELGKITNDYLTTRKILQRFEESIGAIKGLANDPHLGVLSPLKSALQELSQELNTYREELGLKGLTGVGLEWLENLRKYAESKNWKLDAQGEADILDRARNALNTYTFESSGKIRRFLGQARLYARASVPSRKKGFFGR